MKKIITAVLVVCSLFAFSSCGKIRDALDSIADNDAEETTYSDAVVEAFFEAVDNNDVTGAKAIYRDEINGDSDLEAEVYSELVSRLESAVNDYNNSVITDSEANVIYDTISALNILHDNDLLSFRNALNQLIASKAAFDSAESFFSSEDYYNAYQQYLLVIADDTNYSEAVSQASVAADEYVSDVIEVAEASRNEQDYTSAITSVRSAVGLLPNNQDLQTEQTILETEYLQYALDTAASTHQNGNDYEGAIDIINQALTVLDDPSLSEAINYYRSFMPVNLFEMDYYYYEETDSYTNGIYRLDISPNDYDIYGNSYSSGWRIGADYGAGGYCDVYYQLDGQYDVITGRIVPGDGFETSVGEEIENFYATVEIYADDELIFSTAVYCNSDLSDITLDVSNTQMLRIYVHVRRTDGAMYETRRDVEILLTEFFLSKSI